MVSIQSVFIVYFLVFFSLIASTENCWYGLIPLKSTRTDVEKLLGSSKEGSDIYETETEKVNVLYAQGLCKENKLSRWNVPKDTVLVINVIPKKDISVSSFISKFTQEFDKEIDPEIKGVFYYYNADHSVSFETRKSSNGNENIVFILYKPTKNDNRFRCATK